MLEMVFHIFHIHVNAYVCIYTHMYVHVDFDAYKLCIYTHMYVHVDFDAYKQDQKASVA